MGSKEGATWKRLIKEFAGQLGFIAVGFTASHPIEGLEAFLHKRQELGYHTTFEEKELLRRVDAKLVWESCETVGVLAYPLPYTAKAEEQEGVFARSAVGEDYHRGVSRAFERLILQILEAGWSGERPRYQVDTGPLNERAFARRAGLGWIGRNQQLIIPGKGSFVALGLLLLDQTLPYDSPIENQCRACHQCIEACPAKIIGEADFQANRCISYLTQSKEVLSDEQRGHLGTRIFGCDRCQEACPHNRVWLQQEEQEPTGIHRGADLWGILELTKGTFHEKYKSTASGWRGKGILQRNAYFALKQIADPRLKEWEERRLKNGDLPHILKPYVERDQEIE